MKKVIQFLMLPIFCLVLGIGLALTNAATAPIIEQTNERLSNDARQEVLPSATSFEEIPGDFPEGVNSVYKGSNGEGIAVDLTVKGYGGDLNMMVGINADGSISRVKVVSGSETPGVGAKTFERNFLDQYDGKTAPITAVKNKTPDDSEIQAITGASVSSKAVTKGVNLAGEVYEQVKGEL